MAYLHRELGITRFTAKIGEANTPSLTLFEQQLGFKDVRRVKVRGFAVCAGQVGQEQPGCARAHAKGVATALSGSTVANHLFRAQVIALCQLCPLSHVHIHTLSHASKAVIVLHPEPLSDCHGADQTTNPHPQVFEEVHLELKVEGEVAERLRAAGEQLQLGTYDG